MSKVFSLFLIYLLQYTGGHSNIDRLRQLKRTPCSNAKLLGCNRDRRMRMADDETTLQGDGDLKLPNDADLQAELMPQELNPEFVSGKESPWRAILLPAGRSRRDTEVVAAIPDPPASALPHSVKLYSHVASCISLAIAAIIEIVLYVLEFYT